MNPIYKFELTAGATTQRAFPTYKDDLAKDFEKESGQEFFRAKLSGKLTFESDDYTFIVSKAFDTQFVLEIFISYNAGQSWTSYWRGTFWKTDCEFDNDTQTVVVQPDVLDQYNDVLAGMDKEYNLIELAPEIVPVKADKRPMIQVYVPGQSVIGCFLSGMWWEQDCEPVSDTEMMDIGGGAQGKKLEYYYRFALNKGYTFIRISGTMTPQLPNDVSGVLTGQSGKYFNFTVGEFQYTRTADTNFDVISIYNTNTGERWKNERVNRDLAGNYTVGVYPVSGTGATGDVTLDIETIDVYSRFVCDTDTVNSVSTYPIPDDDLVENNRNYTRIIGYYFPDTIYFSSALTSTPNQWGIYQPGQYYQPPYLYWSPELFPVARNAWGRVSIWFTFSALDLTVEESGRKPFTIRHAYPLASVISVLLAEVAPGITHEATTDYSQFLYGTNLIGITQTLLITPKSNIVSAGYDQPAQKAPITLRNVLDMLRDCFRCYWFVDEQNRFRVEHIKYFRNGGSYDSLPVVGIDLTTQQVPRNGKAWAFARNQYKFDKPEMAARYQFGWMDDVTQLFEGFPIDIISKYVNPDNIEQIDISRFTSDIDYILLNPGAVSKDGFVLLASVLGDSKLTESAVYTSVYIDKNNGNLAPGGARGIVKEYRDIDPALSYVADGFSSSYSATCLVGYYDQADNFIGYQFDGYNVTYTKQALTVPSNCKMIRIWGTQNEPVALPYLYVRGQMLPYYNYVIDSNDHYLQNAYVAFCILQAYYAFDMPAPNYEINSVPFIAQGVKKLKNQTIRFPLLNDPDLVELVKTNLGDGTIEKLSINLSSRNANVTLKYDTE